MRRVGRLGLCVGILLATACAYQPPEARHADAVRLAQSAGWIGQTLSSEYYPLQTFVPKALIETPRLHVYIEGDGLAWVSRTQVSQDPTPIRPMALEMALADPSGHAVYLARPCQYVRVAACQTSLWTHERFSAEVLAAMQQAINHLMQRYAAHDVVLIGFSGGGTLAALIASERTDVAQLITVAAPLDHQHWTQLKKISPLTGSLNPVDRVANLVAIPQHHWVGEKDRVVPAEVATQFSSHFPPAQQPRVSIVPNYDHQCCWPKTWASKLADSRP